MKKFLRCLLLLALPLAARAVVSDPVGALRLKLLGASDTIVSLPLHRPTLLEAGITGRSGAQLTLDATVPSLPSSGAYVLVMSGALEGAALPVTSASGAIVTVDAGSYDLATLGTSVVAVIPYWTLDTVFPGGANVHASANILSVQTQILMFNDATTGTNLAASATYFYFSGDGSFSAGWYRFGDMSATRGNTRIPPNRYITVRHPVGSANSELLVTGAVQMAGANIPLSTRAANRNQDNLVALPVPVPTTLANSDLQSGAFTATADILSVKDQLLVYNNSAVGRNKSASATYFYFSGDGFYSAGWYRFGDMSQTVGNVTLKPGEGYIIRKYATAAPGTNYWKSIPSYLQ